MSRRLRYYHPDVDAEFLALVNFRSRRPIPSIPLGRILPAWEQNQTLISQLSGDRLGYFAETVHG